MFSAAPGLGTRITSANMKLRTRVQLQSVGRFPNSEDCNCLLLIGVFLNGASQTKHLVFQLL